MLPFLASLTIALLSSLYPVHATTECDCYIDDSNHVWNSRIHFDFSKGDPGDAFHKVFDVLDTDYAGNTVINQRMTPDNIAFHDGIMELTTYKKSDGQQLSANLKSWAAMQYGSFRIHMAVDGAPGGVAGFFVYRDAWHEQDVEILTDESENSIHYTNHINPSSGPLAGDNPHLVPELWNNGSWRQPSFHRFDWLPDMSYFFFNNMEGKPFTLSDGSPNAACTFQINMWSCGQDWGGEMGVGKSASMKVDWIEAVFNVTDEQLRVRELGDGAGRKRKKRGGECARLCRIDGVEVLGVPELARGKETGKVAVA